MPFFFGIYNYIVITAKALNKNSYFSKINKLHIVVWLLYTMQRIIERLSERGEKERELHIAMI